MFNQTFETMTAEETAEILMQSENLEASVIILEQYANEKVKEQLNSVQSFMQGADEDMVYDYIEKLKNKIK